jgi:squalene-hopene/tetraprenyl-beta-curcumene cyclase
MIINTHYTLFSLIVFFIGLVNCFSAPNISLKLEIERSLDRGTSWLLENQDMKDGNWGSPDYPALTALALRTILGHQSIKEQIKHNRQVEKGFSFLRRKVQSDGGIYGKGLASYNTSISLLAFLQYKKPEDEKIIEDARSFLINQQSDFDRKGEPDNIFDGGIGYGSTWAHSDMSNTHLAMEALYYAKKTIKSKEGGMLDLDWDSAIQFVSRCQNLPESNDQAWVSSYSDDRGGFVYFPGNSMAGERLDSRGRTSLRSYGSMSYAGLLSFIYAEMSPSDKRLVEVRKWLSKNYTIEENPGMGMQGLYYYYHTMAKALSLSGVDEVLDGDGNPVDWREELSIRLFDQQKENGFWINQSGRWWEKDPILVSCYAMLALERIYHAL